MDHYNVNNDGLRVIPKEESAEVFYVRLPKSQLKRRIVYEQFVLNYTKSILKVESEKPLKNREMNEGDIVRFLFMFECKKKGRSLVTAQWDFLIEDSLQTIRIDFYKEC